MYLRLKNSTIVDVNAPVEGLAELEKHDFYEKLEELCEMLHGHMVIIAGDMNT